MSDIGQLRSLTVDGAFILPRSGFVQQIVKVRSASKLAPPDAAPLRRLTKTLYTSGCVWYYILVLLLNEAKASKNARADL